MTYVIRYSHTRLHCQCVAHMDWWARSLPVNGEKKDCNAEPSKVTLQPLDASGRTFAAGAGFCSTPGWRRRYMYERKFRFRQQKMFSSTISTADDDQYWLQVDDDTAFKMSGSHAWRLCLHWERR